MRHFIVIALVLACGGACTTFNNARTLAPGENAAMVTVGGAIADIPGVGTIPLPNVTVEGRHGVMNHLDVNYGAHLLPTAFGAAGAHVGATWQFYDEPSPWVPVLSAGQRFFFFTNLFDARKPVKDFYALSQTDLTVSWKLWDSLIYGGVTAYVPVDIEVRTLHLAPFAGVEVHPGLDWLALQLEGRWLSPTTDQRFAVVNWQGPGDMGDIAVNLGVAINFGALFADDDTAADDSAADDSAADTSVDAVSTPTTPAVEQP